jgi:hypothetical protein
MNGSQKRGLGAYHGASVVGTTIEFFDFYIYATAVISVFPLLFFPKGEGTTALLG